MNGTDLEGDDLVVLGEGLIARCLKRETEHLDGRLYVGRLTGPWKRVARETVKDRGWERDGLTKWNPASTEAEDV